jgi:hypothetical protein
LAYVEDDVCRLISRNGNTFTRWPRLCHAWVRRRRLGGKGFRVSAATKAKLRAAWKKRKAAAEA